MKKIIISLIAAFTMTSHGEGNSKIPPLPEGAEVAILGAGCFWCTEAVYSQFEGVLSVTSGYAGGHIPNPTYAQVCQKNTGHVEVVRVAFDPKVIPYKKILTWFWKLHDPTQIDGQGHDHGPQYASTIFCETEEQKKTAEASKIEAQAQFTKPIATKILDKVTFYAAEVTHQDYYELNKDTDPYCRAVIVPKLEKLGIKEK